MGNNSVALAKYQTHSTHTEYTLNNRKQYTWNNNWILHKQYLKYIQFGHKMYNRFNSYR